MTSERMTRADIEAAMQCAWDAPARVCGALEAHMVGPGASGWVTCADCGQAVFVNYGMDSQAVTIRWGNRGV